jgi:hypothetical protein
LGWLLHEAHLGVVRRGETERADVRQLVVDAIDGRPLEDRQRVNLLPEQLVCLVEVRPCLGESSSTSAALISLSIAGLAVPV